MRFHPAAQILAWCLLVAALQATAPGALLLATGSLLLCAFALSRLKFVQLVRRTRWIMLSLLVIYAYSMPGQPLFGALGMASPSREGLSDGVVQLARLLAALAGLAILLERLHREQLIGGLYTLSAPLQWLGMSRERIAVRLALTLHYAEAAALCEAHNWREALRSLFEPPGTAQDISGELAGIADRPGHLALPLARFAAADVLLLGGAISILWLALR